MADHPAVPARVRLLRYTGRATDVVGAPAYVQVFGRWHHRSIHAA